MDAVEMLRGRRSIRRFNGEKVEREIIDDIIETCTYSPSWANFQIARYTIIEDENIKSQIAEEGYNGSKRNAEALSAAAGAVIISYVEGKSGFGPNGEALSTKGETWGMFDAGIASHQFCLAAYEKGIGTVIHGIFDEVKVAEIISLPEGEIVAAIIPYGYESVHPAERPRKSREEVVRYL